MTALVAFQDVVVERGGRRVLDGASFTLHAGERLAIAGANGAGKTTLLRTLVGFEPVSGGRILAFGATPVRERDFHTVRCRAGLLFQDPDDQLFCPTVIDDVAFGPLNLGLSRRAAYERAEETLAGLDLSAFAPRITHGLSGGEKRLVAVAAVLAMKPDVLLLDEPTNALDAGHREMLIAILLALPVAMILVSHDMPFLAALATRVSVLKEGRLSAATLHRHPLAREAIHIHGLDDDHSHGPRA